MSAHRAGAPTGDADPVTRVGDLDWDSVSSQMDDHGCALTGPLLTASECARLTDLYADPGLFRSTVDMERHRFGRGEYRYFDHPLPEVVDGLRHAFYPRLLPIARHWADRLGLEAPWPDSLDAWLTRCHTAGQTKPTPILLRYQAGDWNALHRDLYGDLVFPLQVVIGLNQPGADFSGGEFLLVEQRPRAQSRGMVRILQQGHGLIFTTRERRWPPSGGGCGRRCGTVSTRSDPGSATRWAWSSTTRHDGRPPAGVGARAGLSSPTADRRELRCSGPTTASSVRVRPGPIGLARRPPGRRW